MARSFASASSQHLIVVATSVAVPPFSIHCRFMADNITANHTLVGIFSSGDGVVQGHYLQAAGGAAGDFLTAFSTLSGAFSGASSSIAYTEDVWHSALGVWAATNDRRVYLDGANKGTNSTSRVTTLCDRVRVGVFRSSGSSSYMNGQVCEIAIWGGTLTDDDAAAIGTGLASPLQVRPDILLDYWPIMGRFDPEINLTGGAELTVQGSPPHADHPRVFYPRRRVIVPAADAAPAAASLPILMHRYDHIPYVAMKWDDQREMAEQGWYNIPNAQRRTKLCI